MGRAHGDEIEHCRRCLGELDKMRPALEQLEDEGSLPAAAYGRSENQKRECISTSLLGR